MGKDSGDLIQGTLDMLVLKALALEPMHGWGITERIQQWSKNVLSVNQGSLYPSLYRLQRHGWITSEWQTTENNRRARFYELTRSGRKQLAEERRNWERLSQAVNLVLETTTP
ncbi:MAG TPA: PadR family transcriptional regulator [Thermoanaerobaculia bacterium]|nr:PadR family transcriptional regulator [Thermoanaerobaculia bacterium]